MMGAAGNAIVYRDSHVEPGFDAVPKDLAGFLKLCQALKAKGTPAGFALGNATATRLRRALARLGARRRFRRREERRRHRQPDDQAPRSSTRKQALRYVHPRHAVVARSQQQQGVPRRAALAHRQRHLGVLRDQDVSDPEEITETSSTSPGRGRWQGARTEPRVPPMMIFVHEVPERRQGVPAVHQVARAVRPLAGSINPDTCCPTAAGRPTRRTRRTATAVKNMTPNGYAGTLGYASAACVADFIIPNMVAEAASARRRRRKRRRHRSGPSVTTSYEIGVRRRVVRDVAPSPCRRRCPARWTVRRAVLGGLFMLPAAALLLPLPHVSARIRAPPPALRRRQDRSRPGQWIRASNFQYLWGG